MILSHAKKMRSIAHLEISREAFSFTKRITTQYRILLFETLSGDTETTFCARVTLSDVETLLGTEVYGFVGRYIMYADTNCAERYSVDRRCEMSARIHRQ